MTVTLVDVRLAALDPSLPGGAVDVEFDRTIRGIRRSGSGVARGDVIDGAGRFLVPGLIDTHVHLGSRGALESAARAGVTTMIDLGTHPDSLVAEQRMLRGAPSLRSAGSAASAPGSTQIALMGNPEESAVTGAADAERFLTWRSDNGSDLIKIIIEDPDATDVPALDVPTITALVEGAHRRGWTTVAHVVTANAFSRGLDAGVDVLTHAPLDRPLPEETAARMLAQGTIASPTLVMMQVMARARLGDRADSAIGNAVESVRRMHAAGVRIVAGTDANESPFAPVPHGASLHTELGLLRQAGLSAVDAVRAATSGAASALGLADRGVVAVGRRADLLLVDGDPVSDVSVLSRPVAVWIAGQPVA
ncbi:MULTISPECIES: amidohydrolase family protein [unclassified Rathayibacter]|uniref:amidohydrolase family protein n=1 Tax=unclassified Rathayibacter TaxID=2609250 RepID=UPI001053DD72|nr:MULTISPECIES: amidohydrolase family protein [unclassified Rathayibacter]TCL83650.1 imidazolonepropionase-like amidohydrolase [Rathayibacter sp. PhB192]TCM29243.1 imidazolonepropionase-like amidohydrolase [Rathayibacter sp. PhB179]